MSLTVGQDVTGFDGSISAAMLILYAASRSTREPNPPPPLKKMLTKGEIVDYAASKSVQDGDRDTCSKPRGEGAPAPEDDERFSTNGRIVRRCPSSSDAPETVLVDGHVLSLMHSAVGSGNNGVVQAGR